MEAEVEKLLVYGSKKFVGSIAFYFVFIYTALTVLGMFEGIMFNFIGMFMIMFGVAFFGKYAGFVKRLVEKKGSVVE